MHVFPIHMSKHLGLRLTDLRLVLAPSQCHEIEQKQIPSLSNNFATLVFSNLKYRPNFSFPNFFLDDFFAET